MLRFWDGFLSVLAGLFTIVVCGIPAWFAFRAIQEGIAPTWVYAPIAGLAVICVILAYAFVSKGFRGVAPSRSRRR